MLYKQGQKDATVKAKEVVLQTAVKNDTRNFDSLLLAKTAQDALIKLKDDTIATKDKALKGKVTGGNTKIIYVDRYVEGLPDSTKLKIVDTAEKKNLNAVVEDIKNASTKDSLLKWKDEQLALKDQRIKNDSVSSYTCDTTIHSAVALKKALEALVKFESPKHPKLKAFWDNVKKPFEIAGAVIIGATSTKGIYDLYYKK